VQYVLKPLVLSNFITKDHRIAFNCDWLAHEAYRFVEGVINEGELDHQRSRDVCTVQTHTKSCGSRLKHPLLHERYATYQVVGSKCHEGLLLADSGGGLMTNADSGKPYDALQSKPMTAN
jgi:hypothetical protein